MASDLPIIFDRFKLDPASGQLYGGGSAISLTPKALSVLEYLAASTPSARDDRISTLM